MVQLLAALLPAILTTITVAALSAVVMVVAAFVAGLARLNQAWLIRAPAAVYVELFRGTSSLVQVYYFFFVLPLLGIDLGPIQAGVLALGLSFGANGSEVVRAGILSVSQTQREAALVLNLSPFDAFRRIILPQALPIMIPSFGNIFIELLKATSLVSLITLHDLAFAARIEFQRTGDATTVYGLVLIIYFALAAPIGRASVVIHRRLTSRLHVGRVA